MLLREILDISLAGRAPKQEPTMFALALCARFDVEDRGSKLQKNRKGQPLTEEEEKEICYDDYILQLNKAAFHAVSKVDDTFLLVKNHSGLSYPKAFIHVCQVL